MPAIQAAVKSFQTILEDLPADQVNLIASTLKQFSQTVTPSPKDPLIESLLGRRWSQEEKLQLELESLFRYFDRRRELLAGALSATAVAKLLGTSRQTPHDRISSQTLLGVLDKGSYRFPAWQFDAEGADGVIDGLPAVLKALDVPDFSKLNWLMRPNPILDGLTPVAALKTEHKERVIQEATAVGLS